MLRRSTMGVRNAMIPTLTIEHDVPGRDLELGDFIAHYANGSDLTATRIVRMWPQLQRSLAWLPVETTRADGTEGATRSIELDHHYDRWIPAEQAA